MDCFKPEMIRAFPDIDFAFLGYNIMRGYPLTSGRDPGFTHRVNLNSVDKPARLTIHRKGDGDSVYQNGDFFLSFYKLGECRILVVYVEQSLKKTYPTIAQWYGCLYL